VFFLDEGRLSDMKADAMVCNEAVIEHQRCDFHQTKPHIVLRREEVKRLTGLGVSQRALAARLGVSRQTVVTDLRAIAREDSDV
jgi:DNA-binding transcriptional regulator YiaG